MIIYSNGSKWVGQEPDTMETLIEVLKNNDLDIERFGAFGFCSFNNNFEPCSIHSLGEQEIHCHGNFTKLSHVFDIRGKYDELRTLVNAIESNIKRQIRKL